MNKYGLLSVSATLFFQAYADTQGLQALNGLIPAEIQTVVDYFRDPKKFAAYSIKLPKGIFLVGRPGSGKTKLAKALSEELKEGFIHAKAQDLLTPQGLSYVLQDARFRAKNSPAHKTVVFIDDFNLGQSTTGDPRIAALMSELDGFNTDDSIIFIAACHSADGFENAMIRSGRFDHVIEVTLPTVDQRVTLLKEFNSQSKIAFDRTVELQKIATITYNFTPADLKELNNHALQCAYRDKTASITAKHLLESIVQVLRTHERADKSVHVRIKVILDLLNKNKDQKKGFARLVGTIPDEIAELVQQIKQGSLYKKFKLDIPKGILLSGPPGTGKTTVVRALSEEAGCDFMAFSASEFIDSLVGGGAQKIRDIFKEARQKAALSESGKTIIFFDEIDALGKRQGNALDSTITELLTQMDGFEEDGSIIVVAASNHPDNIDPALLRPGRFNKIIKIDLPDLAKRKLIFEHYTQGIPLAANVDTAKIAQAAHNYSPADLKELLQKAGSLALKDDAQKIEEKHIIDAMKKILNERLIKGEKDTQQQLDALDVAFKGTSSTKGFNRLVGPIDPAIKDLVDMLSGNVDHARFGLPFPKGILLVGPPGSGKTALARAIAEQAGCEFIQAKGSEFIERFVGLGAKRVRDLFDNARTKARGNHHGKTIIFIDEIDAIGSRNSSDNTGETKQTLTELLTQMDGFYKDDSVIVFAATNIPGSLDPALTRSGRFDTVLEIKLPDLAKRQALFEYYSKGRPLETTISFTDLAKATDNYNAADIKNIVDKAAQIAMRLRAQKISSDHFKQALASMTRAQEQKGSSYLTKSAS